MKSLGDLLDTNPYDWIQLFDIPEEEIYQLFCGDIYNARIHIRGSERNAKLETSQIPMTTSKDRHRCTSQGIKRVLTIATNDYDHL